MGGNCTTFTAKIGVDDEMEDRGKVSFKVAVDGAVKYTSDLLTGTAHGPGEGGRDRRADADLQVTDCGDGVTSDHADWAETSCPATRSEVRGPTTPLMCWPAALASRPTRLEENRHGIGAESSVICSRRHPVLRASRTGSAACRPDDGRLYPDGYRRARLWSWCCSSRPAPARAPTESGRGALAQGGPSSGIPLGLWRRCVNGLEVPGRSAADRGEWVAIAGTNAGTSAPRSLTRTITAGFAAALPGGPAAEQQTAGRGHSHTATVNSTGR